MREAWLDGQIDRDHIEVIAEVMKRLPTWASGREREIVETTLADTARVDNARVVRLHGDILLARIDQDGHQPHQEQRLAEPRNLFRYTRTPEGRMIFKGELEPEIAEILDGLLRHHATPPAPAPGMEDPRPVPQRFGDAVATIIEHAAHSNHIPGHKPRMIITPELEHPHRRRRHRHPGRRRPAVPVGRPAVGL